MTLGRDVKVDDVISQFASLCEKEVIFKTDDFVFVKVTDHEKSEQRLFFFFFNDTKGNWQSQECAGITHSDWAARKLENLCPSRKPDIQKFLARKLH